MNIYKKIIGIAMIATLTFSTSCNTWNSTAKGGTIGAGTGAALGGLLGKKSGNTAEGAILGAAIGGVTGAAIGRYMDKQKETLEERLGDAAEVNRVGEGLMVTFESGLLFGFDSDKLDENAKYDLDKFAETLKEYDETEVLIEGHTDNVGSKEYNRNLSEQRAKAVSDYLTLLGVNSVRIKMDGQGEAEPVASNNTPDGREKNRRVEVAIFANENLKSKAKDGEI